MTRITNAVPSISSELKRVIIKNLKSFDSLSKEEIYEHRKSKFLQIGRDQGFSKSSDLNGGLSYKESGFQKFKIHVDKNKFVYVGIVIIAITSLISLLF